MTLGRDWKDAAATAKAGRHACKVATRRLAGAALKAGALSYQRERDLPALIRLDPFAPSRDSPEDLCAIVARLQRALRAERSKARCGHWTYDLNRRIALRQAYLAESERLQHSKERRL